MKFCRLALFSSALIVFGGALRAGTTYDYSFGGLGGKLASNTQVFSPTSGPNPNVTAVGYTNLGNNKKLAGVDLYSKGSGAWPLSADENGLGLSNDRSGDGEITTGSFLYLDVANLEKLGLSSLDIYMGSTTDGEKWAIWGSNTAPVSGQKFSMPSTGVITGKKEGDTNLDSLLSDRYIFVTSENGNVLVDGLAATTATPEPASGGLLGLALAGSCFVLRMRSHRRLSKVSSHQS